MQHWKVTAVQSYAGWVPYGPAAGGLPGQFEAIVEHSDRPLLMKIEATFDGRSRLRAGRVSVERTDGESVTAQDMAATQLAAVMRTVAVNAGLTGPLAGPDEPADDDLRLLSLARTYWVEYVSWGKPREAVMELYGLPRSTANYWLRKAREKYGLPGLHADAEA